MELTFAERYDMDYERGYRQGSINAVRELLLNAFKVRGEEQNYKISKELLRKIQYETDTAYLKKLMFMAIKDDVNLKDTWREKECQKKRN